MYCYKKSDKDFNNPIMFQDAVKFKTLYNKSDKILDLIRQIKNSLMFEGENEETKQHLYRAMDEIQSFQDNLSIKEVFRTEVEE